MFQLSKIYFVKQVPCGGLEERGTNVLFTHWHWYCSQSGFVWLQQMCCFATNTLTWPIHISVLVFVSVSVCIASSDACINIWQSVSNQLFPSFVHDCCHSIGTLMEIFERAQYYMHSALNRLSIWVGFWSIWLIHENRIHIAKSKWDCIFSLSALTKKKKNRESMT